MSVATGHTGYLEIKDLVPTVVTMDNGHETHWTRHPDPRIEHVLQGLSENSQVADIDLDLGEILIRNVLTDLRGRPIHPDAQPPANGNSIFAFDVAGLCIRHLGHIHHQPTPVQYASLGQMDLVIAPADGAYTMVQVVMARVVKRLHSRIILPTHWFVAPTLASFWNGVGKEFPIALRRGAPIKVSICTLPDQPTMIVLSPHWLD